MRIPSNIHLSSVLARLCLPQDNQQPPISTGVLHRSMTVRFVLNLVQFNIDSIACASVLHRGKSGDGGLFAYICLELNLGCEIYLFLVGRRYDGLP